jgi:hypothetical protein
MGPTFGSLEEFRGVSENVDEHQKEKPNFKVEDQVWLQ